MADADAAEALDGLYSVNDQRTVEQDIAFGIQQIVDIALKALSPGVNDTTTAVICVDHLTGVLARFAPRQFPTRRRMADGKPRVLALSVTFDGLVERALAPIRRNAEDNVSVLHRLLDAVETVGGMTESSGRQTLAEQAKQVAEAARRSVRAPDDRDHIVEHAERVVRALLLGENEGRRQ